MSKKIEAPERERERFYAESDWHEIGPDAFKFWAVYDHDEADVEVCRCHSEAVAVKIAELLNKDSI